FAAVPRVACGGLAMRKTRRPVIPLVAAAVVAATLSIAGAGPASAGLPKTVTVSPSTVYLPADNQSQTSISATVRDSAGAAIGTSGDVAIGPVVNDSVGRYHATLTASTTPGPETITATATTSLTNTTRSGTATLTEFGPAAQVAVALGRSSIPATGQAQTAVANKPYPAVPSATATVTDAGGNRIPGKQVAFTTSGDVRFGSVVDNGD